LSSVKSTSQIFVPGGKRFSPPPSAKDGPLSQEPQANTLDQVSLASCQRTVTFLSNDEKGAQVGTRLRTFRTLVPLALTEVTAYAELD
jgi:hypothetical protein